MVAGLTVEATRAGSVIDDPKLDSEYGSGSNLLHGNALSQRRALAETPREHSGAAFLPRMAV